MVGATSTAVPPFERRKGVVCAENTLFTKMGVSYNG
jgi:hypothetical protein